MKMLSKLAARQCILKPIVHLTPKGRGRAYFRATAQRSSASRERMLSKFAMSKKPNLDKPESQFLMLDSALLQPLIVQDHAEEATVNRQPVIIAVIDKA